MTTSQPNQPKTSLEQVTEKLFELPPPSNRQSFRNWRVTPPTFGNTTGLTIIFEGDIGSKIYLNSKSLIKVSNLVRNDTSKMGKNSFQFQESNSSFLNRSVSNQRSKNPDAELKVSLKYLRINKENQQALLYQKTHRLNINANGNVELDENVVLEQVGVSLTINDFLEPFNHITDSDDQYNLTSNAPTTFANDI